MHLFTQRKPSHKLLGLSQTGILLLILIISSLGLLAMTLCSTLPDTSHPSVGLQEQLYEVEDEITSHQGKRSTDIGVFLFREPSVCLLHMKAV